MRTVLTTAAALAVTVGGVTAGIAGATAASAAPAGTPISFPAGSTSGTVSGQLAAGGEHRFTFGARAEQVATVHFTGSNTTERWTLTGPHGDVLHGQTTEQQDDVTVPLTRSGTYTLDVLATDPGTFSLRLDVPAAIRFAPGATARTVSGRLPTDGERDWSFAARAGQTARVQLSGNATTRFTLTGPDGDVLHGQTTEQQDDVTVPLTRSGTYTLDVLATDPGTFSLRLDVPAAIRFVPGSTTRTVSGRLPADGERDWSFAARAGQTARVHLTGNATTRFTLTGPDGDVLHSQMTEQQRDVSVRLPSSGTYRLTVLTTDAGRYTLGLTIPR